MDPQFWQQFLATDASTDRLWHLLDGAKAAFLSGSPSSQWPRLTEAEQIRIAAASQTPLGRDHQCVEFHDTNLPPAMFVQGETSSLWKPKIGIVGTRGSSSYGKSVAKSFAETLARSGCTIVSGGAIGIDSVVHEAVVESNCSTVCVLPSGIDKPYPARNRELFKRIVERGCVLSPFPCGLPMKEHWLLRRNAVVAALCDALVVVEAPLKSGSLITAQRAIEFGKPVFSIPGPVTQTSFSGSHALIREGVAILADSPNQILESVNLATFKTENLGSYGPHESAVLSVLGGVAMNLELVCVESGLRIDEVLTALTLLEIDGAVERSGDGYALKP